MIDDVVIVGAGPYGLSIAAHLRPLRRQVTVLGTPMGAWRAHMPDGMFLKSTPDASSLSAPRGAASFAAYRRELGLPHVGDEYPIPIAEFIDYGLWFADRNTICVTDDPVRSIRVRRGFELQLASGAELHAANVVIAAGHVAYAWVPPELWSAPPGVVTHSADHSDFADLRGQRVAVVGAGQSALETAALLAEAGAEPLLLVRGHTIRWGGPPRSYNSRARRIVKPVSGLGEGWSHWAFSEIPQAFRHLPEGTRFALVDRILGPFGAWWLRDRVEDRVDVRLDRTILAVTESDGGAAVTLASPTGTERLEVDHVIAATGYRVDLDALEFLDPPIRAVLRRWGSAPVLDGGFESSMPGLFFTGLAAAPAFGPVMRFVCGAGFAGSRIAHRIARRTASAAPLRAAA